MRNFRASLYIKNSRAWMYTDTGHVVYSYIDSRVLLVSSRTIVCSCVAQLDDSWIHAAGPWMSNMTVLNEGPHMRTRPRTSVAINVRFSVRRLACRGPGL